jgi:hypothetical protein
MLAVMTIVAAVTTTQTADAGIDWCGLLNDNGLYALGVALLGAYSKWQAGRPAESRAYLVSAVVAAAKLLKHLTVGPKTKEN